MKGLQLKFRENAARGKSVSRADTLASVAMDIQRVCRIMGELTVSSDAKKAKWELGAIPAPSYAPERGRFLIVDLDHPAAPGLGTRAGDMFEALSFFLSSVKKGDPRNFIKKFGSDPKILEILAKLGDVANLCAEEDEIILKYKDGKEFDFYGNQRNIKSIKELISSAESGQPDQEQDDCIIAALTLIDHEKETLHFKNTMGKKPLCFDYARSGASLRRDIEKVAELKGGFFELHGDFKIKKNGSLSKIKSLTSVKPVNLEKVEVREVATKSGVIVPDKPLTFYPELCKHESTYVVDISPFGNILYEQTRDYLVEEIHGHFLFLWELFAMEEDKSLDPGAQELKRLMLKRFKPKED